MTRRYHDTVQVRAEVTPQALRPSAFVWRGRLYVVREVLDHWSERRAWWRDALDPGDPGDPSDDPAGGPGRQPGTALGTVLGAGLEQQVWRVAASAGRACGTGVYDLTRESLGDRPDADQWRLVRVAD